MSTRILFILACVIASLQWATRAEAQAYVRLCYMEPGSQNCIPVNATTPLPVTSSGGGSTQSVNVTEVLGNPISAANPLYAVTSPSASSGAAVTAAASTAVGSNLVVKGSAGNLYQVTASIGATSGYLMLFNATTLPANGAVTPAYCVPVSSNGTNGYVAVNFDPPKPFATGITAGFSTSGCFTLTASATAAFFAGYK